jgi:hypothetical protein
MTNSALRAAKQRGRHDIFMTRKWKDANMAVIMKRVLVIISANTKTPEAKFLFHVDADLSRSP